MRTSLSWCCILISAAAASGEAPVAKYLFPAGGQRGTTVKVHAGGLFLNKSCHFEVVGPGVRGPGVAHRTLTPTFEGPLLPLPESQRQEDYPRAVAAEIQIAADAEPGNRWVRMWTSQGVTAPLPFVVGELPEIVENEIDGEPIPVLVNPPVTINGRIYPRENIDAWSVKLRKGQALRCVAAGASFGSPLEARLSIHDGHGKRLEESRDAARTDAVLTFVAPADGEYRAQITDARGDGGPDFVYRLTLTSGVVVDRVFPLGGRRGERTRLDLAGPGLSDAAVEVAIPRSANRGFTAKIGDTAIHLDADDLPESREAIDAGDPIKANFLAVPAIGNGRIEKPGEIDVWSFSAAAGETLEIDLRAARLGSPLLGVLTVRDAAGKTLATADGGPRGDPSLRFTASASGMYTVAIRDRFASRGGADFAYRLRIDRPAPDFDLQFAAGSLTVERGKQAVLKILVNRRGGLNAPIRLGLEGLPDGVVIPKEPVVAAGQSSIDIPIKAEAAAKIESVRLRATGTAVVPVHPLTSLPFPMRRQAVFGGDDAIDHVRLAVGLPTPFKIIGDYHLKLVPRGTVYPRGFRIERNGFAGPIEIELADKQARHLQGVAGKPITVPPDQSAFEYAVQLPPWMETTRTCRVCIMGTATVKEPDGREHTVVFSSTNQNEQIIAVVEPERLSIQLERETVRVEPGREIELRFTLGRGEGLSGPATVEAVLPAHFRGLAAAKAELPAGAVEGVLRLKFDAAAAGPFNQPLTIRAVIDDRGSPVLGEAKVELVVARR